jgi:hypothetical protein
VILKAAALLLTLSQPRLEDDVCAVALCAGQRVATPVLSDRVLPLESEQGGLIVGGVAPGSRVSLDGREVPVAPDGRVILGFDRDHGPSARLVITAPDGHAREHALRIAPRQWRLQHVNVARNLPREGDESWTRREAEVLRMNAARARVTDAQGWRQDLIWPARGRISGRFGSQRVYRGEPGSFHSGVDVAAGTGAPVVAPADGVVVLTSPPAFSFEGNLVILDHGAGLRSSFLHLSRVDVREGQRVRQGERIGAVGATGRATGAHLHWSLSWNDAKLDPERVAGSLD